MSALREKFEARVQRTLSCWEWTGGHRTDGYATLKHEGCTLAGHRVAYELYVGPIPPGLEIDHLCRNHGCVNPDHLEAVTHRENLMRGVGAPAMHARKTECIHGHPLSGANVRFERGSRVCRRCEADAGRRKRARLAAARGPRPDACRRGHLRTVENTYIYAGQRFCRACRRAADRVRIANRTPEQRAAHLDYLRNYHRMKRAA